MIKYMQTCIVLYTTTRSTFSMGNGASVKFDKSVIQVNVKHGSSIKYNLAAVEKLCRNGYFQQNFSSLLQAVKLSIEKDALDVLEVLLTLDDVRKTKPLHFASLVGKLESVELLVSAGYACNISDEDGRTPLHLSCSNPSAESGLCTTFLSIRFKNAITAIDNHGNTPLHSAVSNRNIHSVKALLDTVYDPSLILKNKDRSGRTAKDLASNLDYTDIWKLLSDREKNSNQNISSRSSAYSIPTKDQSKNVDQERIMQIWEKFFENAFKRFLIEDDDENDNNGHLVAGASSAGNSRNNLVRNSNRESMNASRIADDKRHSRSTGKKNDKKEKPYHSHEASSYWDEDENEDLLYSDYKKKTSKHNPSDRSVRVNSTQKSLPHGSPSSRRPPHTPAFDYHTSLLSWFDWVVAYDGNYPDGTGYYVIHRHTKETRWLQDHLQLSRPQLLHWQGYVGQVDSSTQMLPRSLMEAVAGTWLPYYDRPTDQCCWISLSSADLQQLLPLGQGSTLSDDDVGLTAHEERTLIERLQFIPYETDLTWYYTSQYGATCWVISYLSDSPGDEWGISENPAFYYVNRLTAETSWDAPGNWEAITAQWGGQWQLCCVEGDVNQLYWFDSESGESVWAEIQD